MEGKQTWEVEQKVGEEVVRREKKGTRRSAVQRGAGAKGKKLRHGKDNLKGEI